MEGSRDVMLLNFDGILPSTEILHPAREPAIIPNGIARPIHRKAKYTKTKKSNLSRNLWRGCCLFMTIITISLSATIAILIHTSHIILFLDELNKNDTNYCQPNISVDEVKYTNDPNDLDNIIYKLKNKISVYEDLNGTTVKRQNECKSEINKLKYQQEENEKKINEMKKELMSERVKREEDNKNTTCMQSKKCYKKKKCQQKINQLVERYKNNQDHLNIEIEALKSNIASYEDLEARMEEEGKEYKLEISKLENDNILYNNKILEIQKELQLEKEKEDEYKREREDLNLQIETLKDNISSYNDLKSRMENEEKKCNSEISKLKNDKNIHSNTILEIQNELQLQKEKEVQYDRKQEELNIQIEILKGNISSYEDLKESMEVEEKKCNSEISKLKNDMKFHNNTILEMQKELQLEKEKEKVEIGYMNRLLEEQQNKYKKEMNETFETMQKGHDDVIRELNTKLMNQKIYYEKLIQSKEECSNSCKELLEKGHNISGVYPLCGLRCESYVYCDQVSDGGGWLVIQRRKYGDENFDKSWDDYKDGFGEVDGDFWYGNKKILKIANNETQRELRFDMCDREENCVFATYSQFYLDGPLMKYTLHFKDYTGTAGNSLSLNKGMMFSTIDQDNDMVDSDCSAFSGGGGWWYNRCGNSNPNGKFNENQHSRGINWKNFKGKRYSLPFMEMKIR